MVLYIYKYILYVCVFELGKTNAYCNICVMIAFFALALY